jgi:putative transposase
MNAPLHKTRRSWNQPGHAHFLTYSCYRRLPLLCRQRTRRWALAAMEAAGQQLDLALWAYVIMPEESNREINRDGKSTGGNQQGRT